MGETGVTTESAGQGRAILILYALLAWFDACFNNVRHFWEDAVLEDARSHNRRVFEDACSNGHVHVVDRLLRYARVDPSANYNRAMNDAVWNGHVKVVDLLLRDGRVDPSAEQNYAIVCAVMFGKFDVVNHLLQDARVDPSANNNYAIRAASDSGKVDVVNRLLQDARVDPSADDNCAIRLASQKGYVEVVHRLVQLPLVTVPPASLTVSLEKQEVEISLMLFYRLITTRFKMASVLSDKDHWLLRGTVLRENLMEEFGALLTDCPPNVNKWFPQGGPGYEEGLEEFMEIQRIYLAQIPFDAKSI